jgi:NAD(P)-dependent dehydrogenase (short-subunit alcohol dehydrogenase family)
MRDTGGPIWPINDLPYSSSKSALNMVTVAYAKELWDTPSKVNATDPGWCDTDGSGHRGSRTAGQGPRCAFRPIPRWVCRPRIGQDGRVSGDVTGIAG